METIARSDTTERVINLTEALYLLLVLGLGLLKQKILNDWVEMGLPDLLAQFFLIESLQVVCVPLHTHLQLHQQRV